MKINYSSPINKTGYGVASLNILKELHKISDVTYYPIGQPSVNNKDDHDFVLSVLKKRMIPDINAPNFKIWHQSILHILFTFDMNILKTSAFILKSLSEENNQFFLCEKFQPAQLPKNTG